MRAPGAGSSAGLDGRFGRRPLDSAAMSPARRSGPPRRARLARGHDGRLPGRGCLIDAGSGPGPAALRAWRAGLRVPAAGLAGGGPAATRPAASATSPGTVWLDDAVGDAPPGGLDILAVGVGERGRHRCGCPPRRRGPAQAGQGQAGRPSRRRTWSCASCSIGRSTTSPTGMPASTSPPTAIARAATTPRPGWGRASSPSPAARTSTAWPMPRPRARRPSSTATWPGPGTRTMTSSRRPGRHRACWTSCCVRTPSVTAWRW